MKRLIPYIKKFLFMVILKSHSQIRIPKGTKDFLKTFWNSCFKNPLSPEEGSICPALLCRVAQCSSFAFFVPDTFKFRGNIQEMIKVPARNNQAQSEAYYIWTITHIPTVQMMKLSWRILVSSKWDNFCKNSIPNVYCL